MCTRFVYNGKDTIIGFNFDIDLSVWTHKVIEEKNRFYIGIKMPDSFLMLHIWCVTLLKRMLTSGKTRKYCALRQWGLLVVMVRDARQEC